MTNATRQTKALAELDALEFALKRLRFEYARGNVNFDTPDYKAFLEAVYQHTEIDAVYKAAQELPGYEPEEYDAHNPYGLTAGERGLVL